MIRTLSLGLEDLWIDRGLAPERGRAGRDFDDLRPGVDLLGRFLDDPHGLAVLREIASDDPAMPDPSSLDDHELVMAFEQRVAERGYRFERAARQALGAYGGVSVQLPPAPVATPRAETAWVEFKVVDDRTNHPIPGVKLTVVLPDGVKTDRVTNGEGLVTFDPVRPGSCAVHTDIDQLQFDDTLEVVGVGDGPVDEAAPPPKADGPKRLAVVERHKVRTGESLDGLAKAHGLTWKQLAKFNFGTDDPAKINQNLRRRVGCTRKTADGKNYVFSDADAPGIIFIPGRVDRAGMGTGAVHVLRVRPLVKRRRTFLFSC